MDKQLDLIICDVSSKIVDTLLMKLDKTSSLQSIDCIYGLLLELNRYETAKVVSVYRRFTQILKEKFTSDVNDTELKTLTNLFIKSQNDFKILLKTIESMKESEILMPCSHLPIESVSSISHQNNEYDEYDEFDNCDTFDNNSYNCDYIDRQSHFSNDLNDKSTIVDDSQDFNNYYKQYNTIEKGKARMPYSLSVIETGGGGDCFYYTVCHMLNKLLPARVGENLLCPYDLRKIVCSHIMQMPDDTFDIHKAVYEGDDYKFKDLTREKFCDIMMDRKYESDNTGISIIGEHFKIKFIIYSIMHDRFNVCGYDSNDYEFIEMLFYTGKHYQVGIITDTDSGKEVFSFFRKAELTIEAQKFLDYILSEELVST